MNPQIANIPMPDGVKKLPIDPVRGFPVPWFVPWLDGKPEFRAIEPHQPALAVKERRCWVCGERLNNRATYVIGPMCVINRISAEPPSHPACAEYSVKACPFLSRPEMVRREGGLRELAGEGPGVMIRRNPGVICLWYGKMPGASILRDPKGGILFQLFTPIRTSFWAEGRPATEAEIEASVESGLPILKEMAMAQGAHAFFELGLMIERARPHFRVTP